MFAVVKTGGKQYKVSQGSVVSIEKICGEVGEEVSFDEVLLVASDELIKVGQPRVSGASVKAKILDQTKAKKVVSFMKRRRKGKSVKRGHRQTLTKVRIEQISL